MKKTVFALIAVLLLSACSPEIYTMRMEVRQPSSSGLYLGGKSFAVAYSAVEDSLDASSFARALEKDYFQGEEKAVAVVPVSARGDVSVDTMRGLVMQTNDDVVFLFGPSSSLYVYDSMGKDTLRTFDNKGLLDLYSLFTSGWATEGFSFYYYDDINAEKWFSALDSIHEGKFEEAISGWTALVSEGKNYQKKACASYNIAMAFFLMRNYSMALQWLDLADKFENITLSPGLRKRINANLQK